MAKLYLLLNLFDFFKETIGLITFFRILFKELVDDTNKILSPILQSIKDTAKKNVQHIHNMYLIEIDFYD